MSTDNAILYTAVYNEDWNETNRIIKNGNSHYLLNYVGRGGRNALHRALYRDMPLDILKLLLAVASDDVLLAQDCSGWTPLHLAILYVSDAKIMMTLDACPHAASMTDYWGQLPLHRALDNKKSPDVIRELLLSNPESVMAAKNNCETPLDVFFSQWKTGLTSKLESIENGQVYKSVLDAYVNASDKQVRTIKWIYEVTVLLMGAILNGVVIDLPVATFFPWLLDDEIAHYYPKSFSNLMRKVQDEFECKRMRRRRKKKTGEKGSKTRHKRSSQSDSSHTVTTEDQSMASDDKDYNNNLGEALLEEKDTTKIYFRSNESSDIQEPQPPPSETISRFENTDSVPKSSEVRKNPENGKLKPQTSIEKVRIGSKSNLKELDKLPENEPAVNERPKAQDFSEQRRKGSKKNLRELDKLPENGPKENEDDISLPSVRTGIARHVPAIEFKIEPQDNNHNVYYVQSNTKQHERQTIRVIIAGGDATSLTTALLLLEYARRRTIHIDIRMYEPRWKETCGIVHWSNEEDHSNRRFQVVTLESHVWTLFPAHVKRVLFSKNRGDIEIWPNDPKSTDDISIMLGDLEEKLLEIIQEEKERLLFESNTSKDATDVNYDNNCIGSKIVLNGGKENGCLDKEKLQQVVKDEGGFDFLVLCDGQSEKELCPNAFGQCVPFPEDPEMKLKEQVLGIFFRSGPLDTDAVALSDRDITALSAAQSRFALRFMGPKMGFLDMWLTPEEAEEVTGMDSSMNVIDSKRCGHSCMFYSSGEKDDTNFKCKIHDSYFTPSLPFARKFSKLWPRIAEGLSLFGISMSSVRAFTKFEAGAFAQRTNFVGTLPRHCYSSQIFNTKRSSMAFTVGNAAFTVSHRTVCHAINSSLISAISLARCLTKVTEKKTWGISDFISHNGLMHSLQDKDVRINSLAKMQNQEDEHGNCCTVVDKIKEGISVFESVNSNDPELLFHRDVFKGRLRKIVANNELMREGRQVPWVKDEDSSSDNMETQLKSVSDETICIFSKCGGRSSNVPIVNSSEIMSGYSYTIPEPLWENVEMSKTAAGEAKDDELMQRISRNTSGDQGVSFALWGV